MLLIPAMALLSATPAASTPPSTEPSTAAGFAAAWLAHQVNDQGFIPQAADASKPNLSSSANAVLALASARVGRAQVDALLAYLGGHVNEFVTKGGKDAPGALSLLIMDAVASGGSPADFGPNHVDLVTRLKSTKQPDGLFGADDPTFDGAFRQGLALLALKAVGQSDAGALDWLAGQQCADGSWTAFRGDTNVACPPVDANTFTGPDTNSTALAVVGLNAHGRTSEATKGANALLAVRNAGGGWGFLSASDQPTDANSTGVVVSALRAVNGAQDAKGVAALLALQVGCDAASADVGGIAFQSAPNGVVPDVLATAQAIPALANVVLPLTSTNISSTLPAPCAAVAATTTTTSESAPTTTTAGPPNQVAGGQLARSGSSATTEVGLALLLVGCGGVLLQLAQDRRRHHP
jgi:hypothetical protein